ncbi:MAG TPA: hypothetical protein VHV74_03245 [Pseudonocardiaceae bacterium]|jgi:hypothetical protein|nr:hypothetical protein [Pseudonocardiaceae bacterium]
MATRGTSTAWTGWVIFSALMMLIIGVINILQGLAGLILPARSVVVQDRLYVVNSNGWALTVLIFGAVLVCVGLGVMTARSWARYTAIVIVGLHAISQIGWLAAYPIWSLLMLALDVVVLYALTARWPDMNSVMGGDYSAPAARTAEHDTWEKTPTP